MNKTPTAWMLRRDGTAFPCQWHYYGSADPAEVEETLYAAEWLYDATQSEETRQLCLDLIAAYGVALRPTAIWCGTCCWPSGSGPMFSSAVLLWSGTPGSFSMWTRPGCRS